VTAQTWRDREKRTRGVKRERERKKSRVGLEFVVFYGVNT